jgi:glyoxylase-like metal-dependent hydrolase (beta-lactamase superfamily II)
MRRIRSFGFTLSLLAYAAAPALAQAPSAPPTLIRESLGKDIYLLRAPSTLDLWTATNVVVIVNERDVTVFDSYTRAGTARMAIAEIRKITDKPVRTLVNSHWHHDHWGGNEEFQKAWPGVQIVATTQTRDFMKRMGPAFFAAGDQPSIAAARQALDTAVATGRQADGAPLTADARKALEQDLAAAETLAKEDAALRRVLPTMAYRDTLILWSGQREFRLISVTGDATASTVLYLPAEKMLVTGDALVAQENGEGGPPWTTTNYFITPWLASLRGMATLDVSTIVPGQGLPFHDKRYLELTIRVYDAIIGQVRSALERGVVGLPAVQAVVDVDSLGRQYNPDGKLPESFKGWVSRLSAKVYQEALDGVAK